MKDLNLERSYIMGILYNATGFLLYELVEHIMLTETKMKTDYMQNSNEDFLSYLEIKQSL